MALFACDNLCEEDNADTLDDVSFKPRDQRLREIRRRRKEGTAARRRHPSLDGADDKENAAVPNADEIVHLQLARKSPSLNNLDFQQNFELSEGKDEETDAVQTDSEPMERASIGEGRTRSLNPVCSRGTSKEENPRRSGDRFKTTEGVRSPQKNYTSPGREEKPPNLLVKCAPSETDEMLKQSAEERNAPEDLTPAVALTRDTLCGPDIDRPKTFTEEQMENERRSAAAEANERAAQLEGRIQVLNKTLEDERADMEKLRAQFSATSGKMSSVDASEEVRQLRAENDRLRTDLKAGTEAFNGLKIRYGKFKEAVVKYDTHEKELIAQIRTLRKSLGDLEAWNKDFKQHAEQKLQDAFEQVCSHRSQLKSKKAELETAVDANCKLEDKLAAAEEQISVLETELDEQRHSECEQAGKLMQEAQAALDKASEENKALKVRMFDSIQTVEELKTETTRLRAHCNEVSKENVDLKQLCEELLSKLETHQ
mmetsp:Transcript_8282/g.24870  ORF Transcript_8282/g.24870 Transcript_8282/m.24870 type:complete len:485 (+) Transcript_8282:130-1584(+)|eukprot:CAMPEP_0198729748 /NCGR_PEP_ID=MMETSP1475-20131203/20803_1 /TAXON_ID= ORGANISM="Unidentified sp., Strain CCMP1999" /NCGR_SAMPLE_ID=MMETSP1475 /ASSEMBLY_ACC=CAM_ASM_001111 /LENGTH=484 /DNA_ID=CAMNT_0044492449 /DNA_START=51 /DNA_END=1505 /DNA_ORIENTATION=-